MVTSKITSLKPLYWSGGKLHLLDQTRLPAEEVWLELSDYRDVVSAIRDMRVRGAPAIGIAGAYAVALAATELMDSDEFVGRLTAAADSIAHARPTGANLGWAVRRMLDVAHGADTPRSAATMIIDEAVRLQDEDEAANLAIGRLGAALLPPHGAVLTHCNAGALATAGYGTALGVVRSAWADGKLSRVYATETRPLLQGARLTAWELAHSGIDTTLLPDSAAGQLMRRGEVQSIVVGADRIAANGDVANKIRNLLAGGPGQRERRALLRRRAHKHHRRGVAERRRDPNRGARCRRSDAPRRYTHRRGGRGRAQPGLRRNTQPVHHGDYHRTRNPPGALWPRHRRRDGGRS